MADASPLTITRAPAWQALTRRLDTAVERDPRLVAARDAILRPVQLLQIMAADAPGALGDDVLQADRLRSLLFLALPYASVAAEGRKLLARPEGARGAANDVFPEPQPYEPGVIDHAALLVVMLAAARVGDKPFPPVFVSIVHGLALAASAAEVLGRLDPRQNDAASLEIVLETLYVIESTRSVTKNEWLRPFALDPVERGRWRCLEHLLATSRLAVRAAALGERWDGATSHEITRIKPRTFGPGDVLTVTVEGVEDPLADAQLVFASADGAPLVAEASVRTPTTSGASADTVELDVLVPTGAETGWIGFSHQRLIDRSNEERTALRRLLEAELVEPCVDGTTRIDPQRAIPLYGELAVPRRRGLNRVESNVPSVTFAAVTPPSVRPGAAFELAWETAGADAVEIATGGENIVERGAPSGRLALTAPADDGPVDYLITPLRADAAGKTRAVVIDVGAPVAITAVEVSQHGRSSRLVAGQPLEVVARLDAPRAQLDGQLFLDDPTAAPIASGARRRGAVAFTIPAELVRDRMFVTIVVTDATGSRASRRHGPILLGRVTRVPLVLARPLVLSHDEQRIDLADASGILTHAAAELGIELDIIDLPWADDDLAVLLELPTGDRDPSLPRVLEALAHRSLITPGFEDGIWLVMLPQDADQTSPVARWEPGYAARALAIAGPGGVERLLADVFGKDAQPAAAGRYVGIHGTLDEDEVHVRELRLDDRRPGPGAPSETGVEAVTRNSAGRELARHVVHVLSQRRPAQLDVLIPISDEVASIELRGGTRQLAVLSRARGKLSLDITPSDDDAPPASLAWSWTHERNAKPRVSLLLRRGALATPVYAVDPCYGRAELPLWRYGGGDGLALYATDGWNATERVVYDGAIDRELTAVVRRLSDGRFFADVPRDAKITWLLDGKPRGGGARTLKLRPGETGVLALEARRGEAMVRDYRAITAGEVT